MPGTSVTYLGLNLKSPVILSSSSLTNSTNGVRRAADAGAGAVVLKSLFEEQIKSESAESSEEVDFAAHPEAQEYIEQMGRHLGPDSYLKLIAEAKSSADIPIIASVNCVSPRWWSDYARQIEIAGADALELNIAIMPRSGDDPSDVEARYLHIVKRVRDRVSLPIAVKIGPYFTSLATFTDALHRVGASALVLFNRFYQLDIDVDSAQLSPGYQFSTPQEIHTALRWISILAGESASELVGSTGIHEGTDAIKMLLAGATAVQVCSTVYQNGYQRITEINESIRSWMDRKGYGAIEEFRGQLAQAGSGSPQAYERIQYIKALTGLS